MQRRLAVDVDWTGSPFFTPRAVLWNIRTLGLFWWLRCLAQNTRAAIVDQVRGAGFSGSFSSETSRTR